MCAFALVACGSGAPAVNPSADPAFVELAQQQLAEAQAAGADPEQVRALERSLAVGEVTYDEYNQALERMFSCFDDAGVQYQRMGIDESRGFKFPMYSYEGEAGGNPVAWSCFERNLNFLDAVYQLQPAAKEATEHMLEAKRGVLTSCLIREGYLTDPNASIDDIRGALDAMLDDPRSETDPLFNPAVCMQEAGISSY